MAVFGLATWVGGSGFLAVYVLGVVVGNRAPQSVTPAMPAMDGYAWLAQAGMFLLLGLLVTPTRVLETLWPALGVAAVLMLVARPLSVWLCLKPLRFQTREIAFISWVGLRGAVPIVLAVFPLMAGLPGAGIFFNVAVVVVLTSLLLQGSTIAWTARRSRLTLPPDKQSPWGRQVYGDFEVPGRTRMADLAAFYGWTDVEPGEQSVAEWMAEMLGRPAVEGDHCALETVELSVRALEEDTITRVGIRLLSRDDP